MIKKVQNNNCRLFPMLMEAGGDDQKKYTRYFKEHGFKYGLGPVFDMGVPFNDLRYKVRHVSVACTEEDMKEMKEYFGDIIDAV